MLLRLLKGRACAALAALLWLMPNAVSARVDPFESVSVLNISFTFNGDTRRVIVLRPQLQPADTLAPVVVMLHYLDGTSAPMANLVEAGQIPRDLGAWVVLPDAVGGDWNHNPNSPSGPDDVGLLAALIEHLVAAYPIDAARVYMGGYSSGGLMSARFACERPEKIAAFAGVGSTMRSGAVRHCIPALATPAVFFNGTKDYVVDYEPRSLDTGEVLDIANILSLESLADLYRSFDLSPGYVRAPENAAFWGRINGCIGVLTEELPDLVADGTTVRRDRLIGCTGGGVDFYTIVEGGHTWPGALDFSPPLGRVTQDISATRVMVSFFSQFAR